MVNVMRSVSELYKQRLAKTLAVAAAVPLLLAGIVQMKAGTDDNLYIFNALSTSFAWVYLITIAWIWSAATRLFSVRNHNKKISLRAALASFIVFCLYICVLILFLWSDAGYERFSQAVTLFMGVLALPAFIGAVYLIALLTTLLIRSEEDNYISNQGFVSTFVLLSLPLVGIASFKSRVDAVAA